MNIINFCSDHSQDENTFLKHKLLILHTAT